MTPPPIIVLLDKLRAEVADAFLPHYKEDAFRVLLVSVALQSGWHIYEPRPENYRLRVPKGKTAAYFSSWSSSGLNRAPVLIDKSPSSKPDVRLYSPSQQYFRVEAKAGMTGTAAEGNSNATKVAADVDLLAAGECELFLGLFDEGMIDRLQGRLSSAGRVKEMRDLLGKIALSELGASGGSTEVKSDWGATPMLTTIHHVTCRSGVALALIVARSQAAGF
jgi:hypothetical protein